MLLWAAVYFTAACAHGTILPRVVSSDVDLSRLVSNTAQVAGHKANILKAVKNEVPYTESRLTVAEAEALQYVREDQRRCFYVRRVMDPGTLQTEVNVVASLDEPDEVTGEYPVPISITSSTATINAEKLGWDRESSTEKGGAASVDATAGFGPFSVSTSVTVFGSARWSSGANGEKSKQVEYRQDVTKERTCPPHSICRVVTWTYTRKLSGRCFMLPIVDTNCVSTRLPWGNTSLALYPDCHPIENVAKQFFKLSSTPKVGFGPSLQGVRMHKAEAVARTKYQGNCTYTHALRWGDGTPVRAQALIAESLASLPQTSIPEAPLIPRALEWKIHSSSGLGFCKLERHWAWEPGNWFFRPKSDGGPGEWEQHLDWPKPEHLDSKCPQHVSAAPTKRSVPVDNGQGVDQPPARLNQRIVMEMINDEVPAYLRYLQETSSDSPPARSLHRRVETSGCSRTTMRQKCAPCPPGWRRDRGGKCRKPIWFLPGCPRGYDMIGGICRPVVRPCPPEQKRVGGSCAPAARALQVNIRPCALTDAPGRCFSTYHLKDSCPRGQLWMHGRCQQALSSVDSCFATLH